MIVRTKRLVYIVLMLLTSALYAEWETITLNEHVAGASSIVVAEFEKELEQRETEIGKEQFVLFNVVENVKGGLQGAIKVRGQAFEMCVAQMFFTKVPKGKKYLLFLKKEDKGSYFNLVHGERSALVINNGLVAWVMDREKIDLGEGVITPLYKVKNEISFIIKHQDKARK